MRLNWNEIKPIIISSANEGNCFISIVDEKGSLIHSNAEMRRVFKIDENEKGESSFFKMLHPIHVEKFKDVFYNCEKDNEIGQIELFLKNGQYHPMKWSVKKLSTNNDELKTFICLGSELQQNVILNNKSNEFKGFGKDILMSIFSKTKDLMWVLDEDSCLVMANPVFLEYYRLDESDINRKISEILPLQVIDTLYDKHLKVLQTEEPLELTEYGKLLDGTNVMFHVNLFLCGESNGKKLVGGIAKDISEKKMIEKKLVVANNRLVNISKISTDAIWEWDMLTGEIIRNEKLTDLTGYFPEKQKGLSWWFARVHPEDRDRLSDTLTSVADNGLQNWKSEYRFLCADGEYKNILDNGYVIYEHGMPVKMIGSLSDITSHKLLENLLSEEKLRQYKNLSESAIRVQEQERSRLGREMHDNVNQILSTIKLFLGMLKPTDESELDIKEKTIEYTLLAIEEIRKLSKEMVSPQLDGGALKDHINNLIEDVRLTTDIVVKFTHDIENDLLSPGKKLTIFRIAQEQLKNTLKYSKANHLEILLYCKNDWVYFSIKDNGVGFDTKKTSSGIGLTNIRERVKYYDGKTEILSSIGNGCQLNVSIPISD